MNHLSESDVEKFVKGDLERAERRWFVRHLLSGCSECHARVSAAVSKEACPTLTSYLREDFDGCFDRALKGARRLAKRCVEDRERLVRGLAWTRERGGLLSDLPPGQARSILPWIRVEILLQLAFEERYRDPAWMLHLERHAQEVADRIEKTPYGPGFLADLRARAWTELANAFRVNEHYEQAEVALWEAYRILEDGTGDLLIAARISDVEASLRKDQRQYTDAENLLRKAHHIYLRLGDPHLAGRTLVSLGLTLRLAGKPLDAAQALRRALSLLDAGQDPQLIATANHDLLNALVDAGQLAEAGRLLFESNLREAFAEDRQCLLRIRWVEGKILARRGRHADAARVFREVRAGFREHGLEYVAAVAGTDEAAMLLQLGKREEAHLLAIDLSLTFHQRGMSAEAERALRFLEAACRGRTATPELADQVGRFLDQVQCNSKLRFKG